VSTAPNIAAIAVKNVKITVKKEDISEDGGMFILLRIHFI
jgi:hypothetical protein